MVWIRNVGVDDDYRHFGVIRLPKSVENLKIKKAVVDDSSNSLSTGTKPFAFKSAQ